MEKIIRIIISLLFFCIFNSCKEDATAPDQTIEGVTEVKPTLNIFTFIEGYNTIIVPIDFKVPIWIQPNIDTSKYEYYDVDARFIDSTFSKLEIRFKGNKFTPTAINKVIYIKIGINTVVIPCVINVVDFYFASTFISNVDTILLPVGNDFELTMTFKDTSGNISSKKKILSLIHGWGYGCGDPNNKIAFSYIYDDGDTTNFNFLLSTRSDITPDIEDAYLRFQLKFSNKEFRIPIKIIY